MPDLNSVPPSPHILAASRRASSNPNSSSHLPTGSVDSSSSSLNILPSNQQTVNQGLSAASLPSPPIPPASGMAPPPVPGQDNTGVGAGPGPLRHPRPLTAAELHSQFEQEQELLVNRLTRDLTLLRAAQNSSVVSNASSTSTSTTADQSQQHHSSSFTDTHLMSGPGFPVVAGSTGRRHHRTSSSASARSLTQQQQQQGGGSTSAPISIPGSAASVLEAARNPRGIGMSRQNSTASMSASHRSRNHSPQPSFVGPGSIGAGDYGGGGGGSGGGAGYFPPPPRSNGGPYHHNHNASLHHQHYPSHPHQHQAHHSSSAISITTAATPSGSELSPGLVPATLRYEETAHYRAELEAAKRENETLKRRIKDLEKLVREQQQHHHHQQHQQQQQQQRRGESGGTQGQGPGRGRSESISTAASASVGGGGGGGGSGGTDGTAVASNGNGNGNSNGNSSSNNNTNNTISSRRAVVERGASTISSVAVGVSDEELRVGESAASAGLRGGAATADSAVPAPPSRT